MQITTSYCCRTYINIIENNFIMQYFYRKIQITTALQNNFTNENAFTMQSYIPLDFYMIRGKKNRNRYYNKNKQFQENDRCLARVRVIIPKMKNIHKNSQTYIWEQTREFLVLGRHLLTELRDKIYCLTDQLMERAGQHETSGYFLIAIVFCNDLRDTTAIDYSKPILDWLKDSKKGALEKWEYILSGRLQPRQKALVDDKKKEILPGFKAGACKHTIVIRDMRLIHPEDIQDRFAYPVVTFQIKPGISKCSVCQIFGAKLVTMVDKWAEENPCYFCDTCYYMLHYANESLLYLDFSVYDCHHDQI
ncbi:hypothetical protein DCAR_0933296 [Daucus carota subsp. sativus]|uniref:snRNA-activating protein complex subunit 3 n=1 Tax=Daucus carota subsp. sativus TaxID=79200 RepID=A0AAF0XTC7_DAUCS|nr:hypothetical protein DCAR_0933296 [Daucus carota subsp. sativus]